MKHTACSLLILLLPLAATCSNERHQLANAGKEALRSGGHMIAKVLESEMESSGRDGRPTGVDERRFGSRSRALDDERVTTSTCETHELASIGFCVVFLGCVALSSDAKLAGAILFSSGFTVFLVESIHLWHTQVWFHICGRWFFAAVVICSMYGGIIVSRSLAANSAENEIFAASAAQFDEGSYEWWRYQIYLVVEEPESSRAALYFGLVSWLVSLYSCVTYSMSTSVQFNPDVNQSWRHFDETNETLLALYFTVEFLLGLWTARTQYEFVTDIMNIIDFCTFAPWWLKLLVSEGIVQVRTNYLRIFRIFKIFRLMRMAGSFDTMQIILKAMRRSADALLMLSMFLCVGTYLISAILWEIDGKIFDHDFDCWVYLNPISYNSLAPCMPYQSIPDMFYYSITTMTTVGYGDIVPGTQKGRMVGNVGMVLGVLVIALPVGVLSTEFQEVYFELKEEKDVQDSKSLGKEGQQVVSDLEAVKHVAIEGINQAKDLLAKSAMDQNQEKLARIFRTNCDNTKKDICDRLNEIVAAMIDMLPKKERTEHAVGGGATDGIEMANLSIHVPLKPDVQQ